MTMSDQNAPRGKGGPDESPATRPPRRRRAAPRVRPSSGDYVIVDDRWVSRAEARRRGLLDE